MVFFETALVLFGVLVNVQAQVDSATNRCPFGLPSTSAMAVYNGRCYQFVGDERYWTGARDYCVQYGGRLVKIDDRSTNDFIVETLNALWWRNNGVWIGLNDRVVELGWQWPGMAPYTSEPVRWTNWGSGHPRAFLHHARDCVKMVRGKGNWLWHETPCQVLNWQYRFICEYEMTATSPAPSTSTTVPSTLEVWQPVVKHSGWKPGSSEHRVHSMSTPTDDRTNHELHNHIDAQEDYLDVEVASIKPIHQAVMDKKEKSQSPDSKWYIALLVVAATVILLLVGLLLWRRRRYNSTKLAAKTADLESLSSKSTKLSDKNCKCSDVVHRVEQNIYALSGTLSRNSNVYEDIEIKVGSSDHSSGYQAVEGNHAYVNGDQAVEGNHAYVAMNGNDKYMTGNVSKISDVTDSQPPKYQNCPVEIAEENEITNTDFDVVGYDVPRPANIYSEIPGADSDIYESFDELKI